MNFGNIRLLNVTHSAASFVQTDDLESFVRAQKGLRSLGSDWVDISRGLGAEEPDRELNATRGSAMHEMVVRAQYKAWLGYMREAASDCTITNNPNALAMGGQGQLLITLGGINAVASLDLARTLASGETLNAKRGLGVNRHVIEDHEPAPDQPA